jgi:hypothetical protein
VSREADSLSSIVRDSAAFAEPGGENVRRAVGTYVRAVVSDEWPQMHDGHDSALARTGLEGIFAAFRTVQPRSPQATAFYDDAVRQLTQPSPPAAIGCGMPAVGFRGTSRSSSCSAR